MRKKKEPLDVYASKPEIHVSCKGTFSTYYDLWKMSGEHIGKFPYGDFPQYYDQDVHVVNKLTDGDDFKIDTNPIVRELHLYDLDDIRMVTFNGYYYTVYSNYYTGNYYSSLMHEVPEDKPYSFLREINRPFFERLQLPTEYKYLDCTLEKFITIGNGVLRGVMWFKDEYGHFAITATDYICMLLNGEKIRGIEPNSNFVVDITTIHTPLGDCPLQNDIDYYDSCRMRMFAGLYLYQAIEKDGTREVDFAPDVPEGSIYENDSWASYVDRNEVTFTDTAHLTIENINDVFKNDAIYLTEDYNLPLFNNTRYIQTKFDRGIDFYAKSKLPINNIITDYREVEENEGVVIEKMIDDSLSWEFIPFKNLGDLVYDMYYKTDELKNKVLEKYTEFKAIYSLINSRELSTRSLDNLGDISKQDDNSFNLTFYRNEIPDKVLSTPYGKVYINYRYTVFDVSYLNLPNDQVFSISGNEFYENSSNYTKILQRDLKELGLTLGRNTEIWYPTVFAINEVYNGIEIMLLAIVLDTNARGGSIKPLFAYATNLLVSDLPIVKHGNRYYIHTTFKDLILQEDVYNHLAYDYNVLRPLKVRSFITNKVIFRGVTRKFAAQLTDRYGEIGIFNFEV